MMDVDAVRRIERPKGLPFSLTKIGHVALHVRDVARSARFYVEVPGFRVSLSRRARRRVLLSPLNLQAQKR